MRKSSLDVFFKPESVAVIGASEKDKTIGQALVHNLLRDGFPGKIYPVNRKYQEIQGLPAYPLVTEVKEPIDLAIIAIPIRDVPERHAGVRPGRHWRRHHHLRRRQGSGIAGQGDRSRHQRPRRKKPGSATWGPTAWVSSAHRPSYTPALRPIAPNRATWPSSPRAAPCAAPSWGGPSPRRSASATSSAWGPWPTWISAT